MCSGVAKGLSNLAARMCVEYTGSICLPVLQSAGPIGMISLGTEAGKEGVTKVSVGEEHA